MEFILERIASFVISVIATIGYAGIGVLMALESANIPIPSEIIMPFAGFLVFQGKLSLGWVVFWGAIGNLAGSLVSYYLGFFGGRPFLEKYGKFFLISRHDLELADRWFQKYGAITAFGARMLPVVRTFISFPAGVARMNIWKFSLYTFVGSLIWSFLLVYAGIVMGENWHFLEGYVRKFDWVIIAMIGGLGIWWIQRHLRNLKSKNRS
ncbi:MAG: DedA family protein [Patescibacteria group bacterium]